MSDVEMFMFGPLLTKQKISGDQISRININFYSSCTFFKKKIKKIYTLGIFFLKNKFQMSN